MLHQNEEGGKFPAFFVCHGSNNDERKELRLPLLARWAASYASSMRKYGRTFHLPISVGATSDDKVMASLEGLRVADLVVTEKMDGENTTLHRDGSHARSPDSRYHPSRDWLKAFAANVSPQLADDERIVGENLYARHSVAYDALPSFFLGFAWIIGTEIQPWDLTLARFEELGITPVPTLYRGPFSPNLFDNLAASLDKAKQEGFVARVAEAFAEADMPIRMGKYVRAGHVQSETHWMKAELVTNRLAGG
ncbi:RNA ligase family protein [Mesorhizobium sp. M0317]|uniref:RNA ligase family protein n=1 Tax=Mesorhizobium sp. M0317 TaxID=2956935 RepID=UPI0033373E46